MSKNTVYIAVTLILMAFTVGLTELYPVENVAREYDSQQTLRQLSVSISIPVSKIREILPNLHNADESVSIGELGIDNEDIDKVKTTFKQQRWQYSWNIVIVGMVVIFVSLALTGLLVGQLKRFVADGKSKSPKKIGAKRNAAPKHYPNRHNDLIAAIATLQLHILEAEESNKMIIAWNREPVSVWKTSGKFLMPNKVQEIHRVSN